MRKLLLSVLFLAAEIGWLWLAIDHGFRLALGIAVFLGIAVVFGRLIGAVAFVVPIVPVVAVFVIAALTGAQDDPRGEDSAWLAVFVYGAGVVLAEAGVLAGFAWRELAQSKTPRNSATVSENAASVASGS
jgi:hypothetical protein